MITCKLCNTLISCANFWNELLLMKDIEMKWNGWMRKWKGWDGTKVDGMAFRRPKIVHHRYHSAGIEIQTWDTSRVTPYYRTTRLILKSKHSIFHSWEFSRKILATLETIFVKVNKGKVMSHFWVKLSLTTIVHPPFLLQISPLTNKQRNCCPISVINEFFPTQEAEPIVKPRPVFVNLPYVMETQKMKRSAGVEGRWMPACLQSSSVTSENPISIENHFLLQKFN